MTSESPYKKKKIWRQTYTQGRRSYKDKGRDYSDASISQKNANDCWQPSETKRQGKILP